MYPCSVAAGAELVIDDLLLSQEEVQETAMRCSWLARYWVCAGQQQLLGGRGCVVGCGGQAWDGDG